MSFEIALMAISAAVQAAQTNAAADEAAYQADINAMVADENAAAAKIEAKEQELRRRRAREEERATNNNMASIDPLGNRAHLALRDENDKRMNEDVSSFQYRGARVRQNLLLEKASHESASQAATTQGILGVAGKAAGFAGKAYKLKGPASTGLQDTGNRERIFDIQT